MKSPLQRRFEQVPRYDGKKDGYSGGNDREERMSRRDRDAGGAG